jgi:RNA-directed DNA polymerase
MSSPDPFASEIASFRSLESADDVAAVLGTTRGRLLYHLYSPEAPGYRIFEIRKASGGTRQIARPPAAISMFQRRLLRLMTAVSTPKPASHGFTVGRNVRTNAMEHVSATLLLNCDLKDFFHSVHFGRVRGIFLHRPFSFPYGVASILAHLCCHHGKLPQGAPTSPLITNLVCRGLDRDLARLARTRGCAYTRYADDITFSTVASSFDRRIGTVTGRRTVELGSSLLETVRKHDFAINGAKTRVRRSSDRQLVTGVVVNVKPNLPRTFIRRIRTLLHACERDSVRVADSHFRECLGGPVDILQHLAGRLAYLGMIRGPGDTLHLRYSLRLRRLQTRRSRPVVIKGPAARNQLVLKSALWVLVGEDSDGAMVSQGTAVAVSGLGLITAGHVFDIPNAANTSWLVIPADDTRVQYRVTAVRGVADLDLALIEADCPLIAALELSNRSPTLNEHLLLAGYPVWTRPSGPLQYATTRVTEIRDIAKLRFVFVDHRIREGLSGSPVLHDDGTVAGIVTHSDGQPGLPNSCVAASHVRELSVAVRRLAFDPHPG